MLILNYIQRPSNGQMRVNVINNLMIQHYIEIMSTFVIPFRMNVILQINKHPPVYEQVH
jgi:hypothetical protein